MTTNPLVDEILLTFEEGQPLSEILEALSYAAASMIVHASEGGSIEQQQLLLGVVLSDISEKVNAGVGGRVH